MASVYFKKMGNFASIASKFSPSLFSNRVEASWFEDYVICLYFSYWIIDHVFRYGFEILVDHSGMGAKDGTLNVTSTLHSLPATLIGLLTTNTVV